MKIDVIILAAGKGTRMNSNIPKVLNLLHGKPLLAYVIETAKNIKNLGRIFVVVGYMAEMVKAKFKNENVTFIEQKEQLGTGHAVMQVEPYFKDIKNKVLVLCGDTPLLTSSTLNQLIEKKVQSDACVAVLTAFLDKPSSYGRMIRDKNNNLIGIKEYKDCNDQEKQIQEINSGVYCFDSNLLFEALKEIKNNNQQNEYYLTDTLEIIKNKNHKIIGFKTDDSLEITGINNAQDLEFSASLKSIKR